MQDDALHVSAAAAAAVVIWHVIGILGLARSLALWSPVWVARPARGVLCRTRVAANSRAESTYPGTRIEGWMDERMNGRAMPEHQTLGLGYGRAGQQQGLGTLSKLVCRVE
ncbi:hypothetical protein IWZ03DRAFT_120887 [Phyllosticta citriasiana]|uniref:Secreted protein n=1 Tax=Phyllosticta citriasiana TaxID=595635 RepID=A0ABR1L118_9PEZI